MKRILIIASGCILSAVAIPAIATQYPFPTGMQVSIEQGTTPVYSSKLNVVYPVVNRFSGTFPTGTPPESFTLQHEDGTDISYTVDGGNYYVDHTVTPYDRVYFSEDSSTAGVPIRIMTQGPFNIGYINFGSGSSVLTAEAKVAMDQIAYQMMQSELTSAYLVGMTDRAGSDSANLALSLKRVKAAASYLSNRLADIGVPDAVITTENMGEYLSTSKDGTSNPRDRKVSFLIFPTFK